MVGEANHANGVDIINAKALYTINTELLYDSNEHNTHPKTSWFVFLPLGGRRGGRKTARSFRGSGRGIEEWRKKNEEKDTYNDTLRLTKLTQASIWHIFLAVFNTPHFASETEKFAVSASLRSAPAVCKWGSLVRGQRGKRQNKRCSLGHRTMRQGSKQKLFAANLRHGRKVRPCTRLWARRVERSGTGGGANEKSTPIGVLFVGSP